MFYTPRSFWTPVSVIVLRYVCSQKEMKPICFKKRIQFYPGCAGQNLGSLNMNISSEGTHWKVPSKILYSKGYNHLIPGGWFPIRMRQRAETHTNHSLSCQILHRSTLRKIILFETCNDGVERLGSAKDFDIWISMQKHNNLVIEARFGWVLKKAAAIKTMCPHRWHRFPLHWAGRCLRRCVRIRVCLLGLDKPCSCERLCVINISGPSGAICFSSMWHAIGFRIVSQFVRIAANFLTRFPQWIVWRL